MVEQENAPDSQPASLSTNVMGSLGAGGALNSSERDEEERGGVLNNSF